MYSSANFCGFVIRFSIWRKGQSYCIFKVKYRQPHQNIQCRNFLQCLAPCQNYNKKFVFHAVLCFKYQPMNAFHCKTVRVWLHSRAYTSPRQNFVDNEGVGFTRNHEKGPHSHCIVIFNSKAERGRPKADRAKCQNKKFEFFEWDIFGDF